VRKIISVVVLLTLLAHFAAKLGIVSYLYQHRNSIAHSVGLIREIPIAICDQHYDFRTEIQFADTEEKHSVPPPIALNKEVSLFLTPTVVTIVPNRVLLSSPFGVVQIGIPRAELSRSIFHPPSC